MTLYQRFPIDFPVTPHRIDEAISLAAQADFTANLMQKICVLAWLHCRFVVPAKRRPQNILSGLSHTQSGSKGLSLFWTLDFRFLISRHLLPEYTVTHLEVSQESLKSARPCDPSVYSNYKGCDKQRAISSTRRNLLSSSCIVLHFLTVKYRNIGWC